MEAPSGQVKACACGPEGISITLPTEKDYITYKWRIINSQMDLKLLHSRLYTLVKDSLGACVLCNDEMFEKNFAFQGQFHHTSKKGNNCTSASR